jgi:hypothetical protein
MLFGVKQEQNKQPLAKPRSRFIPSPLHRSLKTLNARPLSAVCTLFTHHKLGS